MTQFTTIYDKFLSKIEDFGYANMLEEDANEHFRGYLESAITRFAYMCRKDLSARTKEMFLEELDTSEIEILATWMVSLHVESLIVTDDNMRNYLNSRDYKQYSAANLVKVNLETRDKFVNDALTLMGLYDTHHFNMEWREK